MTDRSPDLVGDVPRSRIVIASMVGTTVEFYDFYIYATAAVSVFPFLFFPKGNPTTALLASLATFGLAFVARPIGSVLFGHFGDRIGRKATLVGSLLTMGIATFAIGLLPTYHQVGLLAPALLAILRFAQGLALGGEWSGAALLAVETAKPGRRAWAAMWPQLGAPFGFLLANSVFLGLLIWLGHSNAKPDLGGAFLTWGWRIPVSDQCRNGGDRAVRAPETDRDPGVRPRARARRTGENTCGTGVPQQLASADPGHVRDAVHLHDLLHRHHLGVELRHRQDAAGRDRSGLQLHRLPEDATDRGAVLRRDHPDRRTIADRWGRRKTLLTVTAAIMAYGGLFAVLLAPGRASHGSVLAFLIIGMTLMGFTFGPMSAVLPELFPTNVRYTGSGISYNAASILGAAVAPFIATWLSTTYGVGWVGVYLLCAAMLTFIALLIMRETRDTPLDSIDPVPVSP